MKNIFVKINPVGQDIGDNFIITTDGANPPSPTFASKSALLTGIYVLVDDLATTITLTCTSILCPDVPIVLVIGATTTTTTTTTAPTTTTTTAPTTTTTTAPTTTTTTTAIGPPTTTTTTTCNSPGYYNCGYDCMYYDYSCVPCLPCDPFPTTTTTTTIGLCELICTIECTVTTTTTTTLGPTTTTTTQPTTTTTTTFGSTTTTTTTLPILCLDTASVVNFEQNGGVGLNQFKIDLTVPAPVTSDSNFIITFTATRINSPFNVIYVSVGLTILNGNTIGTAYSNYGLVQSPIELYVITNVLINLYPTSQFNGIICGSPTTTTTTTLEPTTTTTTSGGGTTTSTTTSGGSTTTTTTTSTPQFRISNVVTDCSNYTINITVINGVAPYYYSVDNGKTLVQSNNSTYNFTNLTGGIYDIYVRDSNGYFYLYEEQNCNQVTVIFETVYLTSYSSGYIYTENSTPYTTSFSVTKNRGAIYNTTSLNTNGSTFLGWSLAINGSKPSKSQIGNVNYLAKTNNYQHTFNYNTTVYAIFDKSGPKYLDFCYFSTISGYIATDTDLAYYCPNCTQTIRVYFNENQYNTIGYEKITWYKDVNLTILVDPGYYKLAGSTKTTIYRLQNGLAIYGGSCPNEPKLTTC